jgi:hypothetical protein
VSASSSPAAKLVALDAKQNSVPQSSISTMQSLLSRLNGRCTGASEELLGDMAVKATTELRTKDNKVVSIAEFLKAMDDGIAAGTSIQCATVAAGVWSILQR